MNKTELLARAQELQIEVPEGATNPQISDLIKIAEHPLLTEGLKTAEDNLEDQKSFTEAAEADLETAKETIDALEGKLEAQGYEASKTKGPTYRTEDGGVEFTVKAFRFKGEKYNAEEAVENSKLMQALIEANCSFLKVI